MIEEADVVIVGARCAGSPLAIQLAQTGLRVLLVDRDTFPSDTPSTHFFQVEGLQRFRALGVLDQLKATGAPLIEATDTRIEDVVIRAPWPVRPGDAGGAMCVRRPLLDAILVERAADAGAWVATGTRVIGLLGNGRVSGVRVRDASGDETEVRARLVVGADGRGSSVARFSGARAYNVTGNERFGFWGYYEGVPLESPVTAYLHRFGEEFVIAAPVDSGLFMVILLPPLNRLPMFRADSERAFDDHVAKDPVIASLIAGRHRAGRLQSTLGFRGYFRESAGPGWALVGDAGHFKDPAPAQGISDAVRQADRLARAIAIGMRSDNVGLDRATQRWWRWRDDDAFEKYWFAQDLGRGGTVPSVFVEIIRRLDQRGDFTRVMEVFNHRLRPSAVLTPGRLLSAAARLAVRRRGASRRQVARETRELMAREMQRRRLNRRPEYETELTGESVGGAQTAEVKEAAS